MGLIPKKTLALIGLAAVLAASCGPAPRRRAPDPSQEPEIPREILELAAARYDSIAEGFLDWYHRAQPVRATQLGVHDHDRALPDLSRAGVQARIDTLLLWLGGLQRINPRLLEGDARYDHRILEFAIRAQLLDLEEIRSWTQNPMLYADLMAAGIASLAEREFAPVDDRMRAMMARMDGFPQLTRAARDNLGAVPRLWAEHAIRNSRATARFLDQELWGALESQGADTVSQFFRSQFDTVLEEAIGEVTAYADWLERDVLPRANGNFRIGQHMFVRKVNYQEHLSLTAERLDRMNEDAIAEYQDWVRRVAAEIDPARTPGEIMDSITRLHPSPEELLPTARGYMTELKEFVVANEIVSLPTDALPVVRETPAWMRAGFASMDAPGPFEAGADRAYYNITNVDPGWTDAQKAQHLTYFNYAGLLGITIHEVMPGHFVQLLFEPEIPTDIRKVFTPPSLVEGWAHYTEQMLLDQGYGDEDPVLRLGQLRRALQRHARWYAGLHMHAYGVTIEQATRRFMDIAYFDEFPARREVERGTWDPTYLYYALGRMQILQLREEYRELVESRDETFSLREFHDRFLGLGMPIPLARTVLVPSAGPPPMD